MTGQRLHGPVAFWLDHETHVRPGVEHLLQAWNRLAPVDLRAAQLAPGQIGYRAAPVADTLEPLVVERPLATGDEGISWASETSVAPWAIYVLGPAP